jgi:hypothetical protein
MSGEIKHNRRRFLGTAAMTLAATQLGMFRSADAPSLFCNRSVVNACQSAAHQSFIIELPQFVAVRTIPLTPVHRAIRTRN